MAKRNGSSDFDEEIYVKKVNSAHELAEKLEKRVSKIEEITDAGLIFRAIKKDNEIREELGHLIWQTIKHKFWSVFFTILAAAIIIPLFSLLFKFIFLRMTGIALG